jgi:hypothetical protein
MLLFIHIKIMQHKSNVTHIKFSINVTVLGMHILVQSPAPLFGSWIIITDVTIFFLYPTWSRILHLLEIDTIAYVRLLQIQALGWKWIKELPYTSRRIRRQSWCHAATRPMELASVWYINPRDNDIEPQRAWVRSRRNDLGNSEDHLQPVQGPSNYLRMAATGTRCRAPIQLR